MARRSSDLRVRGRAASPVNVYIGRGQGNMLGTLAAASKRLADRYQDRMDRMAVIEEQQAGRVAGSTGTPQLREYDTLRGQAFNDAALQAYTNRVDMQSRAKLAELEIKHASDPAGFAEASKSYFDKMSQSITRVDQGLAAAFGQNYELRARLAGARIKKNWVAAQTANMASSVEALSEVLNDDAERFAFDMFSGDPETSTAAFENYAAARERLRASLLQPGPNGAPLFDPDERLARMDAFDKAFAESAARAFVDSADDKAGAVEALKSDQAFVEINYVDEQGELKTELISITQNMDNDSRDAAISYARQEQGAAWTNSERARTIAERSDSIARNTLVNHFDVGLNAQLERLKVEEDLMSDDTLTKFLTNTQTQINEVVDSHGGSPESKAILAGNLQALRSKAVMDLGQARRQAFQREAASIINQDVRTLSADTMRNPNNLGQSYEMLEIALERNAGQFMNDDQVQAARTQGRQEILLGALDGHFARGDFDAASELMETPGVTEVLSPGLQREYATRIIEHRTKEDELTTEIRQRRIAFRELNGREPNIQELMDMPNDAETSQAETKQRGEFRNLSKAFRDVRDAYDRIEAVGTADEPSGASDLALIFNYMKMLDPASVVRESEFATAEQAGAWLQSADEGGIAVPSIVRNAIQKGIGEGAKLGAQQRAEFVKQAGNLMRAKLGQHEQLETEYRDLATRNGLSPDNVVIDFVGDGIRGRFGRASQGEAVTGEQTSTGGAPSITVDLNGNPVNQ